MKLLLQFLSGALLIAIFIIVFQSFDSKAATSPLTLHTATGAHPFTVELALTPAQQEHGLMFREKLEPQHGMLFIFPEPRVISMWMKNTALPLDMVFLSRSGEVVSLHENAEPYSEAVISSRLPASAVLEVAGGTASRLQLKPGDRVEQERLR